MTTTIREERKGNYSISVEIDKAGIYETRLCRLWDESRATIVKKYASTDRAKAMSAYRRFRKEI